jgi:hypothetical protein
MYWNYVSCCLTVVSTVLVGKRLWHGWILAGLNSVIICLIGFQTRQWGFIPANLFCLVMYVHNVRKWREPAALATSAVEQAVPQSNQASEKERLSPVRIRRFRRRATHGDFRKVEIRLRDGAGRDARHDLKRSDIRCLSLDK